MKTFAPDYLPEFRCIAGACRHTCCIGWEIEVDDESLVRFLQMPDVAPQILPGDPAQIRLLPGDRCPFLNDSGLCELILRHGETVLCQICRDHPRFRNFWSDRIEMGLGLVCEEAGRLILGRKTPLRLIELEDDGVSDALPDDEAWLLQFREAQIAGVRLTGPAARLREYLLYRHVPDALYDGRLDARMQFIEEAQREILHAWERTDGSLASLVECARRFSYDVEYDDEEKERRLRNCDAETAADDLIFED